MKVYEFKTDSIHFEVTRADGKTTITFYNMDNDLRGEGQLHALGEYSIRSDSNIEMERYVTYFPGNGDDEQEDSSSRRESDEIFEKRLACIKDFMKQTYGWGKIERNIPWL